MVKRPDCANAATVKIALPQGKPKIELYIYSEMIHPCDEISAKFQSRTFIWQRSCYSCSI